MKKWTVSSVEDQCKMKRNATERKTGAAQPQTARSVQNYRHVTEPICSQEGNTGSSKTRRKMINLTEMCLGSVCCESCHGHKHVIANVFSYCVKMLLGCFNYTVIFLYKIVTHLSKSVG